MERTKHVLLSGAGAESFADGFPDLIERVSPNYFDEERRREALKSARAAERAELDHSSAASFAPRGKTSPADKEEKGTVGCVALDTQGNLAGTLEISCLYCTRSFTSMAASPRLYWICSAATSTGGMTNKKWGRVGDSPLIGCGMAFSIFFLLFCARLFTSDPSSQRKIPGNYANNNSCAVSGTGTGEEFIRHVVGHDVSALMQYKGLSLNDAANEVVWNKLKQVRTVPLLRKLSFCLLFPAPLFSPTPPSRETAD
jgi:beta-aspartyl-peptidase (threonine type)